MIDSSYHFSYSDTLVQLIVQVSIQSLVDKCGKSLPLGVGADEVRVVLCTRSAEREGGGFADMHIYLSATLATGIEIKGRHASDTITA